ncbi:MAG TPA: hypothetical protein VMI33_13695 [Streptosporangiaceae bacterium]|nr:hypothetical protein [Streptosporangiaceae bacterium]
MTPAGHGDQPDPAAEPGGPGLVGPAAHPPTGAAGDAAELAGAQHVPTLKLAEIIMAVIECGRRLPLAASVALVREPRGEGTLLRVVFLDGENEPIPADADVVTATTYVADRLDDDLAVAFGGKSVIVLKLEAHEGAIPGRHAGPLPAPGLPRYRPAACALYEGDSAQAAGAASPGVM